MQRVWAPEDHQSIKKQSRESNDEFCHEISGVCHDLKRMGIRGRGGGSGMKGGVERIAVTAGADRLAQIEPRGNNVVSK